MAIIKFFTDNETKKILQMRQDGASIRAISVAIHRSRRTTALFLNDIDKYMMLKQSHDKLQNSSLQKDAEKKTKTVKVAVKKKPTASPTKTSTKTPTKYSKSTTPKTTKTQSHTVRELAEFNQVILEHRCVIKFMVKLGETVQAIYSKMKQVYAPVNPELPAIRYWAQQYRSGRTTVMNVLSRTSNKSPMKSTKKSKSTAKSPKPKTSTPTKPKVATLSKSDAKKVDNAGNEQPAMNESTSKFTIKLPGLDRLTKKSG